MTSNFDDTKEVHAKYPAQDNSNQLITKTGGRLLTSSCHLLDVGGKLERYSVHGKVVSPLVAEQPSGQLVLPVSDALNCDVGNAPSDVRSVDRDVGEWSRSPADPAVRRFVIDVCDQCLAGNSLVQSR